ncbi:MAG TPA: hypothetical protein VL524_17865 [Gemmatimonadaceae bacterium]|nr:hypothetical protein [Gemmatimonadaceae bacterium]
MLYAGVAVILFGIGHYLWRRQTARDRAELWLAENRYHVRELRIPWFVGIGRFPPTLLRSSRNAFVFRAVVEDKSFGGTGVVWLRIWTGWLGRLGDDVEVSWERMPKREASEAGGDGNDAPIEERWAERQLTLLRRIQHGETTFRPSGRGPAAGAEFDELVEYLLAMQRRGLITCGTPLAGVHGESQYAAVTNAALTEAGERVLQESEQPPDASSAAPSGSTGAEQ